MLRKQPDPQAKPQRDDTTEMAKGAPQAAAEPRAVKSPGKPDDDKFDHLAARESEAEDRQEALLDEAIEETFPGSDPISPKHIT